MRTLLSRTTQPTRRASAATAPVETAALQDAVYRLEEKLKAVTERERAYRRAMTRLEDELKAAGALQRAFLPAQAPAIDGITTRVLFRPCTDVSGDAYDIIRIDDTHVAFVVTDATGHGVSAALLSTLIRRTLRDLPHERSGDKVPCPVGVLERANNELSSLGLDDCQFVAAVYAVLNECSGAVRLARGGTPFPVVLRNGQAPRVITSDGPILGAMAGARFDIIDFVLEPGDRLLLYSDGVEPLIGAGSSAASVEQAWATATAVSTTPSATLTTDALFERIETAIHAGGALSDDVTLLSIERNV